MNLTARLPISMQRVTLRAILYMILSAFCFSFIELIGQRLTTGMSAYQTVWGRYVVHVLVMLVVLGPRYKTRLVKTNHLGLQFLRSMTMVVMPICAILSWKYMPVHDSWSVYWTAPLVMLGLSVWVLREPAGTVRWIASLLGFIGMLFIFQPDREVFVPAIALSFGMGAAISLHLMLSRVLRHDHPLTSLFHTGLWVFVVMAFFVIPMWQAPSLRNLLGLFVIGSVGVVGLYALARSSELVPIPIVAFFSYSEAIWGLLINVLILGIMPDKRTLLGTLIILVVCGYMLYHELRQPDPLPDEAPELVPATK